MAPSRQGYDPSQLALLDQAINDRVPEQERVALEADRQGIGVAAGGRGRETSIGSRRRTTAA